MNMNNPGIRPRNNKPATGPNAKPGAPQTLRVLSDDGAAQRSPPSIVMPRAKTDLSELLAGDSTLCVRRRSSAPSPPQNAGARSGTSGANAESQAEPPPAAAIDADLACVIAAWPGLPQDVRAAVLAMIRETATGSA